MFAILDGIATGLDDIWEGCFVVPTPEEVEKRRAALQKFLSIYNGRLNGETDSERLSLEEDYAGMFWAWSNTMEHPYTVYEYWRSGMVCAQHMRLLRAIDVCPFSSDVRRDTIKLLKHLAKAERKLAAIGERTISIADFESACKDPGFNRTAPMPIFHLLRVKRDAGEAPVFHAASLLRSQVATPSQLVLAALKFAVAKVTGRRR